MLPLNRTNLTSAKRGKEMPIDAKCEDSISKKHARDTSHDDMNLVIEKEMHTNTKRAKTIHVIDFNLKKSCTSKKRERDLFQTFDNQVDENESHHAKKVKLAPVVGKKFDTDGDKANLTKKYSTWISQCQATNRSSQMKSVYSVNGVNFKAMAPDLAIESEEKHIESLISSLLVGKYVKCDKKGSTNETADDESSVESKSNKKSMVDMTVDLFIQHIDTCPYFGKNLFCLTCADMKKNLINTHSHGCRNMNCTVPMCNKEYQTSELDPMYHPFTSVSTTIPLKESVISENEKEFSDKKCDEAASNGPKNQVAKSESNVTLKGGVVSDNQGQIAENHALASSKKVAPTVQFNPEVKCDTVERIFYDFDNKYRVQDKENLLFRKSLKKMTHFEGCGKSNYEAQRMATMSIVDRNERTDARSTSLYISKVVGGYRDAMKQTSETAQNSNVKKSKPRGSVAKCVDHMMKCSELSKHTVSIFGAPESRYLTYNSYVNVCKNPNHENDDQERCSNCYHSQTLDPAMLSIDHKDCSCKTCNHISKSLLAFHIQSCRDEECVLKYQRRHISTAGELK